MTATLKDQARAIFAHALKGVSLQKHMERRMMCVDDLLCVGQHSFPLHHYNRALIVAMGKAAAPMASHAVKVLRGYLPMQGLVLAPSGANAPAELEFLRGSHPLPDETSLQAAQRVLQLARAADHQTLVLWLISGGASAMLEMPLAASVSMDEMIAFHRVLVHSGLNIGEMNALRKHVSAVKGGRLAVAASRAGTQITLLVSDVPEGQQDVIASGPTLPDTSTIAECRGLLPRVKDALPSSIVQLLESEDLPETPKPEDAAFAHAVVLEVLSSATLCEEAAAAACELGFDAVIDNGCDEWRYDKAAMYLLYRLARLRAPGKRVALISAGEVSVPITGPAGEGGRNQHFALYAAQLIREMQNTAVLSAGSDGIDGHSDAAGAVVDTATWDNATGPQLALDGFDSGRLFREMGDAIVTGPTGNNLRDLRVFLAED